ncbi:MAG: hypothetical protein GQ570_09395 [Helicobacteraceae bacterium]|nr:hypothetical protein [Helicobacteraceae bacterium]
MKSLLLIPILATTLLSDVITNAEGTFLQIYANKTTQSKIIATVPSNKGKIINKRCFNTRGEIEWCKIVYKANGVSIDGFSDKKSLDALLSVTNTKPTFEKVFGGRYKDIGNDILVVDDGILIVGTTESLGTTEDDAYIVKVDNFGNKIFEANYGGDTTEKAKAVIAVKDGYMIAGSTSSFGNDKESIYLAKIAKNGKLIWQHGYFSDFDDYYKGNSLTAMDDGKVLVAGYEDHLQFFNSEVNGYMTAIDSKGVMQAHKYYGGEDKERINSIITVDGGYVFAGETDTWGHGAKDAYFVKIDKEGKEIFSKAFGWRYDEVANEVIATTDGGYLLVGTSDSDHYNQKDIYVVKTNKDGNREWHYHYGSRENEEGNGVVEVNNGYVIAGSTTKTKSYNKDAYILKIDKTGAIVWHKNYGGESDDAANAIAKVKDGFVITGYATSPQGYNKDLLLLKVDENGNVN